MTNKTLGQIIIGVWAAAFVVELIFYPGDVVYSLLGLAMMVTNGIAAYRLIKNIQK